MKIGIGLPGYIPWASGRMLPEWARRAEKASFSSLGIIDRIAYGNLEPLITLSAAASVTKRIRLMTSVFLMPIRNTVLLAKQAATLDVISGGRLTLGLGIGTREGDFQAASADFRSRAKRLEEQLKTINEIWSGEGTGSLANFGPRPVQKGRPEILIGGHTPKAVERAALWGDGFISGGADPRVAASLYKTVQEAWSAAAREGKPRFVCCVYYALGKEAEREGGRYLRHYYSYLGAHSENIVRGMISSTDAVKETVKSFRKVGADELVLWACIPKLEQISLLARAVRS